MKKTLIIITTLIIGIAIGIKTSELLPKDHPQIVKKAKSTSTRVTTVSNREQTPIIKMSQNKAIRDFHRLYPQAKINEIKLSIQHQSYIYDIAGYDTKKDCTIKINASTGEILGQSTLRNIDEEAENEEDNLKLNKIISRKEASQIALQQAGRGDAREWTLNMDDAQNTPVWNVKVVDNNEVIPVKINALSKEVINN